MKNPSFKEFYEVLCEWKFWGCVWNETKKDWMMPASLVFILPSCLLPAGSVPGWFLTIGLVLALVGMVRFISRMETEKQINALYRALCRAVDGAEGD